MAPKTRGFTVKAREAAIRSRAQRSNVRQQNFGVPEVFVIRKGQKTFGWEIRCFGAVVVYESSHTFDTFIAAKEAGASFLSASVNSAGEESSALA